MNEKIEFTPFTPEESSILEEGGVVTKLVAMGWAAFTEAKGVGRHTCTMFFGKTEEEAREVATSPNTKEPWHGVRADGPHFH